VREHNERGVHPLKAYFACIGGCVGIGNIAAICTAIQLGGPGALFWIWVTATIGMIIKYSEVYLGMRYRVANKNGGYNGGPMYFLQKVFKTMWIPNTVCVLLCIYGVEVYQFTVITDSVVNNLHINQFVVIFTLLGLVLFAGSGGVRRVGDISSAIIPIFVVLYLGMGGWVLFNNLGAIPSALGLVFSSAFTGSAAFGGFAGSSLMLMMSQGVRRGCYTGDLGVGYAAVIHSESNATEPQEQATLTIFEIFLDTFVICTASVMIVLVTGVWHESISPSMMVQTVLEQYFPYMNYFMPLFLFMLGYSTINAYYCVGLKSAEFLHPKHGRKAYIVYAIAALILFSYGGVNQAQSVMTIANGLLLIINCYGIFRLRHEISFSIGKEAEELSAEAADKNAFGVQ
jgi:AGCS family alanine or glycine:cation symporter